MRSWALGLLMFAATACSKTGNVLDSHSNGLEPCPEVPDGEDTGLSVEWMNGKAPRLFWTGDPLIEAAVSSPGLLLPPSGGAYRGRVHWAVSSKQGFLSPLLYGQVPDDANLSTNALNWLNPGSPAILYAGECYQFSVTDRKQLRRTLVVRAPSDFVPQTDPCVPVGEEGTGGLWVPLDGPVACNDQLDTPGPDAWVQFTGSAFTFNAARCRSQEIYFGTQDYTAGSLREDVVLPSDTSGYCLVNGGTEAEFVIFAICGRAEPEREICNDLVDQDETERVTAEWFYCPGPSYCPPP